METKNKKEYVERVRKRLKFKNGITVEPCGIGERLALWWKEDVRVQTLVCTKNIIVIVIFFTRYGRGVGCFGCMDHLFLKKEKKYERM